MAHKTEYNAKAGIIETTFEGMILFTEMRSAVQEIVQMAQEKKCLHWMNDFRDAAPHFSTIEIFEFPELILDASEKLGVSPHKIKRAIVVSQKTNEYKFAETISLNRNQSAEVFEEINEARNWLKK